MARHLLLTGVLLALLIPAGSSAQPQTAPSNTGQPVVSGNTVQGETLTTSNGTWDGSTPMTFEYRWLRCDAAGGGNEGVNCETISGETRNTYVLTAADVGHTIRSRVIATNADGTSSKNSNPTAAVQGPQTAGPPVSTAPPTISGTAQQGKTLTTTNGSWQGDQPQTYTYQWRRCDAAGGACANIANATGQSYLAQAADIGHTLRVIVTGHNALGESSATSAPSAVVVKASAPAGASIPVSDVALPNRLIIDRVQFSPFILRAKRPFVARFHVSDLQGHSVSGAMVFLVGIPFGNTTTPREQATDAGGNVTFVVRPTFRMKMSSTRSQPFFVRARKPGDRLIGGVSIRRLVNLSVRAR